MFPSLLGYTEQYVEYDFFLTPPDPSNPWISDDTGIWELEARCVCVDMCVYICVCMRVRVREGLIVREIMS